MHRKLGKSPARLLTLARDLTRRKARERSALFVAEGIRAVEELLRSDTPISGALTTAALREDPRGAALVATLRKRGADCVTVSDDEFRSAAGTENPQGVLAIGEVPARTVASLAPKDLAI